MFGSNINRQGIPGAGCRGVNTLSEGTLITGDVTASGDIRIDGRLDGNLKCDARVIIGSTGYIEGNIMCKQAIIEGELKGEILVDDLISLLDSARVTGTIRANKMAVGAGCVINGLCTIRGAAEAMDGVNQGTASFDLGENKIFTGVAVAG